MRAETLYLMVRVAVLSDHKDISETTRELESESLLSLQSTPKVHVVETEILSTRVPNPKKYRNDSQQ